MQGRLRGEALSVTLDSRCAQSGQPVQIEIDSDLNFTVMQGEAGLRLFTPMVDFGKLAEPSIIDVF